MFDRTGTVYNGDLIATVGNNVYRIDVNGNYTQIAKGVIVYEGLEVVPNVPERYGDLAGKIILPQRSPYTQVRYIRFSYRSGRRLLKTEVGLFGLNLQVVGSIKSL